MNRVVIASVIAVLILLSALAAFIYYNKYRSASNSALNAVPTDAVFIINGKLNDTLVTDFISSAFIKNFTGLERVQKFGERLKSLQQLAASDNNFRSLFLNDAITVSVHSVKADDFDFIFYLNGADNFSAADLNQKIQLLFDTITNEALRNYVGVEVHDLQMKNNKVFTYAITSDILIASYTPFLVEDAIRQIKAGKPVTSSEAFRKLSPKNKSQGDFNIYISYKNITSWLSTFSTLTTDVRFNELENFAAWSKMSVTLKSNSFLLNGISTASDTSEFINLFANQTPKNLKVFAVMPRNTAVAEAFSFSNRQLFFNRLNAYNNKSQDRKPDEQSGKINPLLSKIIHDEYGLLITEPGSTIYANNSYAYFNVNNIKEAKKILMSLPSITEARKNVSKIKTSGYRNHQVVSLPFENAMASLFGSSFKNVSGFYYTDISNFIFIGNNLSALKALIDAFEDNNLLATSKSYMSTRADITFSGNYFYYAQVKNCYYILQSKANAAWNEWLENNRYDFEKIDAYSYSIRNNNSTFETTAYLHTSESAESHVSPAWSVQLDYPIATEPQVIETGSSAEFIAIQDTANQLYLFDNSGALKWKKELPEKIISKIFSLDVYKNGTRELAFNSENNLWILSMEGNALSNFPIHLPSPATTGLSVADYDSTRDYRIYIPGIRGDVYGYEASGKPIPGWTFRSNEGIINEPLQYFKLNGKDYLFVNAVSGKVFVTDRMGKPALKINEPVYKQNATTFYLISDSVTAVFACIDTAGNIVKIDTAGNVMRNAKYETRQLKNFYFTDINRDGNRNIIDVFENEIAVLDANQKMIFDYTAPEKISSQIIVDPGAREALLGFSNAAKDNVYVVNRKGKLIPGFPVKSVTAPQITDLNGDKAKKLITCGDSTSVTVYSF